MTKLSKGFLKKLENREVVTPLIEAAMVAIRERKITDNYSIDIDLTRESDFYFHPSSHCLQDERKLFYLVNPKYRDYLEPWSPSYVGAFAMAMGTAAHNIIQSHLVSMGYIAQEDVEIKVFDEEKQIMGHMDFLAPDKNSPSGKSPVELKTMNPYQFKYLKAPLYSWICQFNVYMDVLGYDYGYVVVLEQATPYGLKEFKLKKDPELLDKIYTKWDNVSKYIKDDIIPMTKCRDSKGLPCQVGSKMMQECPAYSVCRETFDKAVNGDEF